MRPLAWLNSGRPYSDQVKPFNFLLTCHVNSFGYPAGANAERFHLIAPYDPNPQRWLAAEWIDQYSGKVYGISTTEDYGSRLVARVKSYGDLLEEYQVHPETKYADENGNPCGKGSVGILKRRRIRIDEIRFIGKESNTLEEVDSGLVHSAESVYTEYPDVRRDEWETNVRPVLSTIPLSVLARKTGLSRRMLIDARTGRRRPHRKNQDLLAKIKQQLTQ